MVSGGMTPGIVMVVCICILVVGAIIGIIFATKKSSKGTTESKPTVVYSEDFKPKDDFSVRVDEEKHQLQTIYMLNDREQKKICPNCEVENDVYNAECCVCHYTF